MCLFVHHAWSEQQIGGNGKQKGWNQVPYRNTDNKPVDRVSVHHLQTAQTGLVLQSPGNLLSVHIWAAQAMVDHFSYLINVHKIKSTMQENNSSGKTYLERWEAKFGF